MFGIETSAAPASFPARLQHAFSALFRGVSHLWQAIENRRQIGFLASLDDRHLADIGISRSDVHAALATRVAHDPSDQLCCLAREKRQADISSRAQRTIR